MRRPIAALCLGCLSVGGVAAAQAPRAPDGGSNVRAFSTRVEALERARRSIDQSNPQEALRALAALRGRDGLLPAARVVRAMAQLVALPLALEPHAARAATPAQRVVLLRATATLDAWLAANPDDALAALLLGRAQLMSGELERAERSFEGATRALPRDPRAWNDRAMVLVALRRLADAADCLEAATRLAPSDPTPWSNLGALLLARGRPAPAVEAFSRAVELEPERAQHRSDLGSAHLAAGDPVAAIRSYERAAALAPGDGVILSNLGYALSLASRDDEALTVLRRAVAVAPQSVGAWNNLGAVLARRRELAEARRCFERALEVAPADPRARGNLEALPSP